MTTSVQGPLARRTFQALAWTYGGAVARAGAQLVVQLLLARYLGPKAFGEATAALLIQGFGWIFAEAGFGSALIQKREVTDSDVGYALGWVLMVSGTSAAVVALASPWIADALGGRHLQPLILVSGLLIPVQAIGMIPASLMKRQLDAKRPQMIFLTGYLLGYGLVGLPMAATGAGSWALVTAFAVCATFGTVASYAVVRHPLRPRLYGDRAIRRFGFQVTATNCVGWAVENVDRALIANMWGSVALGTYSAAYALSRAPSGFLLGSLQPILFGASSRVRERNRAALGSSYLAATCLTSVICWPLFAWMGCNSHELIHLLYGDRWSDAAPLFLVFCLALPSVAVMTLTGPVLWALDKVLHDFRAQVAGLLCVVGGLFLLRNDSLSVAVWVIPATFFLRALWMGHAAALGLHLEWRRCFTAFRGAVVLALTATAVCAATGELARNGGGLAIVSSSAGMVLVVSLLILLAFPRLILNAELIDLLRTKAASGVPKRAVGWLRLES